MLEETTKEKQDLKNQYNYKKSELTSARNKLKKAEQYKYLGEIITPDGKLDETIRQRGNQITGITAELTTIISLIDDDDKPIQAVKRYHEAIILPKLLTNAETWSNITRSNILELECIQNKSLKRLLRLPQGTPSAALEMN